MKQFVIGLVMAVVLAAGILIGLSWMTWGPVDVPSVEAPVGDPGIYEVIPATPERDPAGDVGPARSAERETPER